MKFWKKALLINLIVILVMASCFVIFLLTPFGRPFGKTLLLIPEIIPDFPIRPIKYFTKNPAVSTIEINSESKKVLADIYRPNDEKKHPAIVITLGILATRQNSDVVKLPNALSREGFVVMVPNIPDFISGFIWTDSTEILVSSVKYLEGQTYVRGDKIGIAGFCVGSSISIVTAEDPRVADAISFIVTLSPYFNTHTIVEDVLTRRQKLDGKYVNWVPAGLTDQTVKKGFANAIEDEQDRKVVLESLLTNKQMESKDYQKLSDSAKSIYDFFNATHNFQLLPDKVKEILEKVSPSTNIGSLKAKVFMLNDKLDTFVPKSEGEELARNLPKDRFYFIEVDSFEHVNPRTKLPRLALVHELWAVGNFLYSVLSHIEIKT